PDRLARATAAHRADAAAAFRLAMRVPGGGATGRLLGPAPIDEHGAKALFARRGLAVPDGRACDTRAGAHQALAALGGPVVVKLRAAALTHKSDVDGVRTGVRTADGLDEALDAIDAAAATLALRPRYLVERQAPPGPELIVGATRDPAFGPSVLLGLGGTGVELAADPDLRLAPLSELDARDMVAGLPAPLLAGYRGAPPVDREAVATAIRAVAGLLLDHDDVVTVEANPVRLTRQGAIALDAVVVLEEQVQAKEVRG
ncbi:acetate--CoA ligase family protein, partial [Actinophytocola sediminis]